MSTAACSPTTAELVSYRVCSGDTLLSIAVRSGVSERQLRRWNRIPESYSKLPEFLLIDAAAASALRHSRVEQRTEDLNRASANSEWDCIKVFRQAFPSVSDDEALVYVRRADGNAEHALYLYRSDMDWAEQQRTSSSTKCERAPLEQRALMPDSFARVNRVHDSVDLNEDSDCVIL